MNESTRTKFKTMNHLIAKALACGFVALFATAFASAEEGGEMPSAQTNVANVTSLQRGARTYFNYCSGCHSIKYMSYARLADDLQLSEAEVLKSFAFTGARIGD